MKSVNLGSIPSLPANPITENTLLVGHSCGAGFLVRWLSEYTQVVDKVALVAPWIDPHHAEAPRMFDDLALDETLAARTNGTCLFFSLDDDSEILESVQILRDSLKHLEVKEFKDRGHFTQSDMRTEKFPELKDYLLQ